MEETFAVNGYFIKSRIEQLELKIWWIAEQIRVDRATISRWISGRVKWGKKSNLESLARVLQVPVTQITIHNPQLARASDADVLKAANLIYKKNMKKLVSIDHNYDLLEYCIKSSLSDKLPLNLLARLYFDLSNACFWQYKLQESIEYIDVSIDIFQKIRDDVSYWEAKRWRATIDTACGSLLEAIASLQLCSQKVHDPISRHRALHNIIEAHWLRGDYLRSHAMAVDRLEDPSYSIDKISVIKSYIAVGKPLIFINRDKEATDYLGKARQCSEDIGYQRGVHYIDILLTVNDAISSPSKVQIERFKKSFSAIKAIVDDPYWYYFGAIIHKRNRMFEEGLQLIDQGMARADGWNTELGLLAQVKTEIFLELDKNRAAVRSMQVAMKHFEKAEAYPRIEEMKLAFSELKVGYE
ncbi:hypothetical protein SAMN06296036_1071 [Pseudobacteriovorax antillogorgiicola]|uniref:HTH cro/C1-type domain-containing protein n=2 Tax=Pseudobacteriovorax antillogorgiicola TaxID=1513793 RepID=A0A1Y6BNC5_9BACT|nr:hypothetical protein EDD56_107271 [Pseudobacteriovorax antillogorgiicola]SMF20051.1 hypothetical protein SAMN06296036_1071 [Pseudobacteriovorax antillogorgiicola]